MCTEVRQAKGTTLRRAAAHACRGQPRLHYEQSAVAEMRKAAWLPLVRAALRCAVLLHTTEVGTPCCGLTGRGGAVRAAAEAAREALRAVF